MIDHTDVHLLVPDRSAPVFVPNHAPHARRRGSRGDRSERPGSIVAAAVYDLMGDLELPVEAAEAMTIARQAVSGDGVSELGRLVTAGVPNDFPRLPVHEDVTVAVWLLSDPVDGEAATTAAEALADSQGLTLRTTCLAPTARSTLR